MELINLFKNLAEISSVSGEEELVSNHVVKYLQDLGLKPAQDKNNMVFCRVGNKDNPKLFSAHLDTVEPGRNIEVKEKNGYLVSNGKTIIGADNKVSVSAILFSLQKLLSEGKDLNLELLFTVREETDSGIREFDFSKIKSKIGFVFDIGGEKLNKIALSAPYIQDVKISIYGKSAHAAAPEDGINTLEILRSTYKKLKIGRLDKYSTFNLGLINGGSASNSVPEYLYLSGDLRSGKIVLFDKHKNNITKILHEAGERYGGNVSIEWVPYSSGYKLSKSSENFKRLRSIYKENGILIEEEKGEGASDAGFLNSIDIETFCLSDGVIDSHTVNERINIKTFNKLQKVVEDLMVNF